MRDTLRTTAVTDIERELRVVACVACQGPAEVTGAFQLPGASGHESDVPYVRTRCLDGHLVVVPAFTVAQD